MAMVLAVVLPLAVLAMVPVCIWLDERERKRR
jgi:hypothetical protein